LLSLSSFLLAIKTFLFLMILCKYERGGKLIACPGQVFAQVTHPTLHFNGATTIGLFFSKSKSVNVSATTENTQSTAYSSSSTVGCHSISSRRTPCHLSIFLFISSIPNNQFLTLSLFSQSKQYSESLSVKNSFPQLLHVTSCNQDSFLINLNDSPLDGKMIASLGQKLAHTEQPETQPNGLTTKALPSLTSKTP
jgi:hypothetical protein